MTFVDLRRLQAKSKVQAEVLNEFLFADDMVKGAPTEEKMQKGVGEELYKHICLRSNPVHIYIITCLLYAVQRDLK